MSIHFVLIEAFFIWLLIHSYSCCQIDPHELCECALDLNVIKMNCRLVDDQIKTLDFDQLTINNSILSNKTIDLTIENKRVSIMTQPPSGINNATKHQLACLRFSNNFIDFIDLNAVANDLPNLVELEVYSSKLKELTNTRIDAKFRLEVLKLGKNEIFQIQEEAFYAFDNLQYLFLYANKLRVIRNRTFNHLSHLKKLDLSLNELGDIETNSFHGMTELTNLTLNSNKLRVVRNDTFNRLFKLLELRFDQNSIAYIETNALRGLVNLDEMDLSANKLTKIENNTFNTLRKLVTLWMYQNQIR